ncbi:MAG: hypothetical protein JWL92_274 [Candidatus Nomurabacteria bacterium]|nr:hypothetical protein [Candidatus Nomurabacteria bacterium]
MKKEQVKPIVLDGYQKDIQKLLRSLENLGFPEIKMLLGKYFTFTYNCPVYGYVMLGGRIENIAYNITETWRAKRRVGALIDLRISTNVTQNFGMRPNEDKSDVYWQHGMHTLEFNNKHSQKRTEMCATWSFIKPRTHAEVEEYHRLTNLEVEDKIPNFRTVMLIKKLEKGQVIFQ